MRVDTKTQDAAQATATLPIPDADQVFNWKNCWYPVTFLQDLPSSRPYSFSLYDEALVLFRNQDGKLVCLTDRCPHRAAKLSDGQIIDGNIECLYHGWQFGIDGQVTNTLKQTLVGVAIALAALAIVTDGSGMQIAAVSASLLAGAMVIVAQNIKTHFERSYTRH